ncbi:MAG: DUF928 domain-containing protein [Elainellaceae cyanobacterium]
MILLQRPVKTMGSLALAVAIAVGSICGVAPSASADSRPRTRSSQDTAPPIFVPPTDETHTSSRAGGSRGASECRQDSGATVLAAIAPEDQVGLTTASHPTVLVYIPDTSAQQIYFSIKAASGEGHYEAILPIPQRDSIVALSLPTDAAPLAVGETYGWGVGLICTSGQTDMPWEQGQIRRVLSPAATLPNPPLEQATALGQAGLWYDAVEVLRRAQPTAAQQALDSSQQGRLQHSWTQLLDWAGVEASTADSILSSLF